MSYNGTITIKFIDGLASLTIDDGASRIPIGILDRWMRTKGVKLFRAQQQALDKKRVAARAGTLIPSPNQPATPKAPELKTPPIPRSEASAPPAQPKTGPRVTAAGADKIMASVRAKHQASLIPSDSNTKGPDSEQTVINKLNKGYEDSRKVPEAPHPEMEKIDAAIARAQGETGPDTRDNSAIEEKVDEAAK